MKPSTIFNSNSALLSQSMCVSTEYRSLNLATILIGSNKAPQDCLATSVSLSGMFIQSDSIVATPGEIAVLEFRLLYHDVLKRCRIPVELAEIEEHGVTVYFHQFNSEIFGYISKLMFDADMRETIPEQDWTKPASHQIPIYGT